MSDGAIITRPVWVGLAIRLDDGRLYAVEMERDIEATIDIHVDEVEDFDASIACGWRVRRAGDLHVEATVKGIGKTVTRFSEDLGADRRTRAIEPAVPAIEAGSGITSVRDLSLNIEPSVFPVGADGAPHVVDSEATR